MQEDKLTDIEEFIYYKKYYHSRKTVTIITGIICFVVGFALGKIYYQGIEFEHADNFHPTQKTVPKN